MRFGPRALLSLAVTASCAVAPSTPARLPVPVARYDFTPAGACNAANSARLTIAVVSPQWRSATAQPMGVIQAGAPQEPRVVSDLRGAMRADFLELITCRGYLVKGPFDNFDAMVFPDREASQLLLEPELQMGLEITNLVQPTPRLFGMVELKTATGGITGMVNVGGRVTLNLKEPVTNTRMWSKSIEVPRQSVSFETEGQFDRAITIYQAQQLVLQDDGFRRAVQPLLERTYSAVFTAADNYLNTRELAMVASQAAEVRKRGTLSVPR